MSYEIPKFNLDALNTRLAALNKRAEKLGCPPVGITILREFEIEVRGKSGVKYQRAMLEVEPVGESPKLNGWKLIAAIEMLDSGENLVRIVPGETCPEHYRDTDSSCDHCKTDRRRKEVFVLRHEDGRHVQVGRSCIADFLGHISVDNLVAQAEWRMSIADLLNEAGDEGFHESRGERVVPIQEFLGATAIIIRRIGWVSNKKAREESTEFKPLRSTSSIAWQVCTCHDHYTRELVQECDLHEEERDEVLAKQTLDWAREQHGGNDYLYNLGVACRLEYVKLSTTGLVGSAIAAYLRNCERVEELQKERQRDAQRKHVGIIDERMDFTQVTIKKLHYIDGNYGVRTLVKFETQDGNILIWWASKEVEWQVGDVLDITGTVVKHSEFNGCPQTELKRVAERRPKPQKVQA